jgi:hypothetical protein
MLLVTNKMNDPLYNHLLEASWRRKLTEAEQAQLRGLLAAHPESQADWGVEMELTSVLDQLPDAPVATNFTARVLQAVEQEAASPTRRFLPLRLWEWHPGWLPKAAFVALVLGASLFSYRQVLAARRAEMARSVATVCGVPSLPSAEILKDFDAIWAMDPSPPADEELLMLLR